MNGSQEGTEFFFNLFKFGSPILESCRDRWIKFERFSVKFLPIQAI